MKTLFLRFPDEAAALAAFSNVTGEAVASLAGVLGKIEVSGLPCDVEPLAGWHVNIRTQDDAVTPEALLSYVVELVTPSRVFV